jgi:hypothetical protein
MMVTGISKLLGALLGAGLVALMANACGEDCTISKTCGGAIADGDAGGNEGGGTDGGGDVQVPPDCNATAEPKDAPACVVDGFGVFVDATSGNDSNAGTKALPVKTIGAALGKLGGKPRVYVCEGTYAEHVNVTSAVAIYGGFACGTWNYSGTKAKVAPTDAGYALSLTKIAGTLVVADLSFTSAAATEKGASSIAAFVSGSPNVTFVRAALEAGAGKEGADGTGGETGTPDKALDGIPASGTTQGVGKTCTCAKSGGATSGGAGGAANGDGQNGAPNLAENPTGHNGGHGAGGQSCSGAGSTGSGNPGADAANASDGLPVTTLGALGANGWTPASGVSGVSGVPGQGGGGGGGRNATSAGGGGACGGCGGTGGQGGGGGGASVALVALDSAVTLRSSTLTTHAAGNGGKGGVGGSGVAGGFGGPTNNGSVGCPAGDGGRGGNGGAGSGGAGGVSTGVLYKGGKPTLDATTVTTGDFGLKGVGGKVGVNDGIGGVKADTLEVQ